MADADSSFLPANSLAEAFLYILVTPCAACGRGPIRGEAAEKLPSAADSVRVTVRSWCPVCGATPSLSFALPSDASLEKPQTGAVVNPGGRPSRLIDLPHWLTLFRMIVEAAARETDKVQARHLGLEAAQCLEEALRFYDDEENDLPGDEAFFSDASRLVFHRRPEQFSRQRLMNLRSKLPSADAMRAALSRSATSNASRRNR